MPIEFVACSGWRAFKWKTGRRKAQIGAFRPTFDLAYQEYLAEMLKVDPPLWHRLTGVPETTRRCLGCRVILPIEDFRRTGPMEKKRRRRLCFKCMANPASSDEENTIPPPPPPPHPADWYRERIAKLRALRPKLVGRQMSQKQRIKRGVRIERRIRLYYDLLRRAQSRWEPGVERAWNMEI